MLHSICLAGGRKSTVLRVSTFFIVYMERGVCGLERRRPQKPEASDLAVLEIRCEPPDVGGAGDVSRRMWAVLEM